MLRFAAFLCLSVLTSFSAGQAFAWERVETLLHRGQVRSYLLHVPDRLPAGRHALVLVFHGGGGDARNAERMTGMSTLAEREGFIVAYPNGSGRTRLLTWNAGNCCGYAMDRKVDDVGFVRALIDRLAATQPVDSNRVYATGMSNGGMMSYRLGCELAGKIAAIAPVAGAMDGACRAAFPVSLIAFHGMEDRHVPYEGGEPARQTDSHARYDRPVRESVAYWVKRDGCTRHETSNVARTVTEETWSGCGGDGVEVRLYTLQGFGHAWPGGGRGRFGGDDPIAAVNASETIWSFFHKKRSAN